MDTNKHIAKALLNKSFAEAKELVFKSLYAKASLALDEARFAVANSVFNEAAKTTGVPAGASEDKFTAARAEIKKAGHKAKLGKGVPAGSMKEEAEQIDEAGVAKLRRLALAHNKAKYGSTRAGITNPEKAKRLGDALSKMKDKVQAKQRKRNFAPASAFGMKEEVDQIDELLTPMRDRITARERDKATADYNNPNLSAAQQKKAAARASRATYARLRARSNDGTVAGKAQTPKFKRENEKWRKVEKSVKEEVDQLDEVSPPGMEKMTGSKKTKASFAKQYGKRGKSVMYATAWKLHNKKAKD